MATNIFDPNQDQSADSGRVSTLDKNINATSKEVGSSERKFYGFTKPDYGRDKSYERRLIRTATRGVVQLFNAVAERQRFIDGKMTQLTGAKRSERKKIIGDIKANNFKTILQNNAPKNPKSSVYLKEEDVEVKNEQKNPIAQKLNTIPNTSFGSLTLINSNTDDELEIKEELESESDSSCCET